MSTNLNPKGKKKINYNNKAPQFALCSVRNVAKLETPASSNLYSVLLETIL